MLVRFTSSIYFQIQEIHYFHFSVKVERKSCVQRWKRPRRPRCGERSALQRGKMSVYGCDGRSFVAPCAMDDAKRRPRKEKVWKRSSSEKARINAAQSECMHTNLSATNRIRSAPAISFATMPLSIYRANTFCFEFERASRGWMGCCAQMSATPTVAGQPCFAHFSISAFCFSLPPKSQRGDRSACFDAPWFQTGCI